ncbi:MAG: sigma-70 family RNA polymerase sigma factor [Eubacteriales bacterium]|nr:sigma-70 family RNA polymerase sigma factor [Eubacteriales bacterium]
MVKQIGADDGRVTVFHIIAGNLAFISTQDSFLKAYRALDALRGLGSEKAWLMRIAINTCKDMQRSRWWRLVDRRITTDDLPEQGVCDEYPDKAVLTAVMNLPMKYRQTVLLHYYQGMTLTQVAQALDVPPGTVRTRLMRAKERLRGQLEGWYFDEE